MSLTSARTTKRHGLPVWYMRSARIAYLRAGRRRIYWNNRYCPRQDGYESDGRRQARTLCGGNNCAMNPDSKLISDLSPCSYLPGRISRTEYQIAHEVSKEKLQASIETGWRRQGAVLFRPVCPSCNACQSIRVPTATFELNRSQRRVMKANTDTRFAIQKPIMSVDRIALYVMHHNHHAEQKGWKTCTPQKAASRISMLWARNHLEEWSYYIEEKLVAISYVDAFAEGLSGVYFYHHPEYRQYSLGTLCVLTMILRARELGLPYAYLGFYVAGCRSMEYKGRFGPAQVLAPDGTWVDFHPPQ